MNYSDYPTLQAAQTSPRPTQDSTENVDKYRGIHLWICVVLASFSGPENLSLCLVHLPTRTSRTLRIQNAMFVNHCIANILHAASVAVLSLQLFPGHNDLIEFLVGLFYLGSVLSVPIICVWR